MPNSSINAASGSRVTSLEATVWRQTKRSAHDPLGSNSIRHRPSLGRDVVHRAQDRLRHAPNVERRA
jgi:hypothetical protein